jgi:hypothetical protein
MKSKARLGKLVNQKPVTAVTVTAAENVQRRLMRVSIRAAAHCQASHHRCCRNVFHAIIIPAGARLTQRSG